MRAKEGHNNSLFGIKPEKYYLMVLIYIPLLASFWALERYIEPKYEIYCFIDSYIPYIPFFVVFYFVWFIYMFLATAYFMFYSKSDFIRLTLVMAIGMASSYVLYVIFPNSQPLRPSDTGGGIFGGIVAWLYSIDTPTNVCPSIHVINTLGVHFTLSRSEPFKDSVFVKRLSLITAVLINLSTMLIKQHSIIDVALGVLLALCIDYLVKRTYDLKADKEPKKT